MAGLTVTGPEPADERAGEPASLDEVIVRVGQMESLLELICECGRSVRVQPSGPGGSHLWLCPAGLIEFWAARYPERVEAWLERLKTDPPPQPVW